MENRFYALTASGANYEISQEVANRILQASNEDLIELKVGVICKVSAITSVISAEEYFIQFPTKFVPTDSHQPYSQIPGTVFTRSNKNAKEIMLKGFKKVKPEATMKDLKGSLANNYIKYKTWEEAKSAGVF